jgi:aldose 1-epimerase
VHTASNDVGMTVRLMTLGASLIGVEVPDREGSRKDVVLGFDTVAGYESPANGYFGHTVGRFANRIAGSKFSIEGQVYQLATNDGPNHLHGGGKRSVDKVLWLAEPFQDERGMGVVFRYLSPAGEEGYPGELSMEVSYTIAVGSNRIIIDYSATSDAPTPVNLSNHAYFNLAGQGAPTINDHRLMINAGHYTPVDETLIPTGEIAPVEGTPFDFRTPEMIGKRVHQLDDAPGSGYDHNFVLNSDGSEALQVAAVLKHSESGRSLTVHTTEPGLQFYGGNFLDVEAGKAGASYVQRSGLCLEAQHFPDSPNQPGFPNVILRPGETYRQTTVYEFGVY